MSNKRVKSFTVTENNERLGDYGVRYTLADDSQVWANPDEPWSARKSQTVLLNEEYRPIHGEFTESTIAEVEFFQE